MLDTRGSTHTPITSWKYTIRGHSTRQLPHAAPEKLNSTRDGGSSPWPGQLQRPRHIPKHARSDWLEGEDEGRRQPDLWEGLLSHSHTHMRSTINKGKCLSVPCTFQLSPPKEIEREREREIQGPALWPSGWGSWILHGQSALKPRLQWLLRAGGLCVCPKSCQDGEMEE